MNKVIEEFQKTRHLRNDNKLLKEVLQNFIDEVEASLVKTSEGMIVPNHRDFVSAPPSIRYRLRWWADKMKSVIEKTHE